MDIYGLLGESLKHSISPKIHSLILKEIEKEGNYKLYEVEKQEIINSIDKFKMAGVVGINVTIPYKTVVMKYLDYVSDKAKLIGAVNTICFKDNITCGHNTDYTGFGMMLKNYDIEVYNKKAVILGSGGSSKSVIAYLVDNGISEITIVSRGNNKINIIHNNNQISVIYYEDISKLDNKDIIINCTPCGMYPNIDICPIEKSYLSKFSTVVDLIYNPNETVLLKYSKELNKKAVNGLYMLIGQAVAAQELWHDIKINNSIINSIYERVKLDKYD